MASAMLATAVVGAAGLIALGGQAVRHARIHSLAAPLAAARLAELRALPWSFDNAGSPVSDLTTDLSVEPAAPGGAGLRASPIDALARDTPGYVDYLDATGRWVGGGAAAPPAAVFVRRWSIQPLAADPLDTLVIQVLVLPVTQARRARAQPGRGPGEVLLASVRTRTAPACAVGAGPC